MSDNHPRHAQPPAAPPAPPTPAPPAPAAYASKNWARWLQWILPVTVIAALAVGFREELPFFGEAWDVLKAATPLPLVAAVCTAFLALAAMAGVMQILLNVEGRIASPWSTNAITFASNAWSTTVPGGPAISAWLTYRVHRSWGASVGLCGWFFVISGALSTVWMVVIGAAAVLLLGADLSLTTLAASFVLAAGVIWALFWATRNPSVLKRWARFLPVKVHDRVASVIDQVAAIRMGTGAFTAAAVLSLVNQLLDVATLYFSVWAVTGTPPGVGPAGAIGDGGHPGISVMGVALAFILTKLAGAAQVTPGGVGTVEPVAAAMLVAGGLTLVDATAVTLVYRAISFALITIVGWIIYLTVYTGRGLLIGQLHGPTMDA